MSLPCPRLQSIPGSQAAPSTRTRKHLHAAPSHPAPGRQPL